MSDTRPFPKYRTYEEIGKRPSALSQEYPKPTFRSDENYYPINKLLEPHFSSQHEIQKFGAAIFCDFLENTIEVEHCLVIPAIASLRRLPYTLPTQAQKDLYKTVTDEGFHAEVALQFAADLRSHFGLQNAGGYRAPLFFRRLEQQRLLEPNPVYRDLITVLNGVVTETRISRELSKFASDAFLAESVRSICRTHAQDEVIHGSQFRALGLWLWGEFDETTKAAAARFFTASTIARSLPDVEKIAYCFHQSTDRPLTECKLLVYSLYTVDVLIEEMLFAARPTVSFLDEVGVNQYLPFSRALDLEREKLASELAMQREALG